MSELKQIGLYANLMGEVKVRIDGINHAISGKTGLPTPLVREFCYLQLRLLCELLALSSLVAHGDIRSLQSHRTGRSYSADEIIKKLAELRPHFYPTACKQIKNPPGQHPNFHLDALEKQPLPKEDLMKLYAETHKFLHRGSLKKLLSSPTPIDISINLPAILSWAQRINDMLAVHFISISDSRAIICILRNIDNNGKVEVAIADAVPPGPFPLMCSG